MNRAVRLQRTIQETNNAMKGILINLPEDVVRELAQLAGQYGMSRKAMIEKIVRDRIDGIRGKLEMPTWELELDGGEVREAVGVNVRDAVFNLGLGPEDIERGAVVRHRKKGTEQWFGTSR
jgi:predicted transcriptional regulator